MKWRRLTALQISCRLSAVSPAADVPASQVEAFAFANALIAIGVAIVDCKAVGKAGSAADARETASHSFLERIGLSSTNSGGIVVPLKLPAALS